MSLETAASRTWPQPPGPVGSSSFSLANQVVHDQPQATFENLDLTASLQCCMHLHAEIDRRSAVALDSTGSSPLSNVVVAILNCCRKCREEISQMGILGVLSEVCPEWGIVFLSEVDFKRSNVLPFEVLGHRCDRH